LLFRHLLHHIVCDLVCHPIRHLKPQLLEHLARPLVLCALVNRPRPYLRFRVLYLHAAAAAAVGTDKKR
jgi:hypothetical protein